MNSEGITIAGSFAGIFLRTVLAYVKAKREAGVVDSELFFNKEYAATAIIAAATSGAAAILLFPSIVGQASGSGSAFAVFAAAFSFGWFSNDVINMAVSVGSNTIRVSKDKIQEVREFLANSKRK